MIISQWESNILDAVFVTGEYESLYSTISNISVCKAGQLDSVSGMTKICGSEGVSEENYNTRMSSG